MKGTTVPPAKNYSCEYCHALNYDVDTHCWQCGKLLPPPPDEKDEVDEGYSVKILGKNRGIKSQQTKAETPDAP